MMIKRRLLLFPILLTALLMASPIQAGKFYKWVDDKGVTHYGENPPDTETASVLNVKSGASSDQAQAIDALEARRKAANTPNTPSADDKSAVIEQKNREIMAKNCNIQRQNMSQLKANRRVKETNDKGEVRYLNEEEIANRIKEVESYISENCKDL
jgi:hypothetical protein